MSTATENCPHDDCEGQVVVEVEFEPGDPNYGADADGRRGVAVAGYWSATAADTCSLGHVLDADAKSDVCQDATWQAAHDQEDEYYGPDGPNDEDY